MELFAEEVVRGGPAFAVSLILSSLEPALRAAAELGAWQIISPVSALGRVEVVGGLHEVQEKVHLSMAPWQSLKGGEGSALCPMQASCRGQHCRKLAAGVTAGDFRCMPGACALQSLPVKAKHTLQVLSTAYAAGV